MNAVITILGLALGALLNALLLKWFYNGGPVHQFGGSRLSYQEALGSVLTLYIVGSTFLAITNGYLRAIVDRNKTIDSALHEAAAKIKEKA